MQSNSLNRPVQAISSRVVGVLVVVFVEVMYFSALISSYFVIKKGRDIWNAAGSIGLPVLATGFNTAILIASGFLLFNASKSLKKSRDLGLAKAQLLRTIIFAGFFFLFQAFLGMQLIQAGLTISSSVFGGCLFLMIGSHLLQVIAGIYFMIKLYQNIQSTPANQDGYPALNDQFNALQIFWFFVVGIWPVIYAEVYF